MAKKKKVEDWIITTNESEVALNSVSGVRASSHNNLIIEKDDRVVMIFKQWNRARFIEERDAE